MTLRTELKNLLQSRDQQPLYHQHLKSRLGTVGLLLLEQVSTDQPRDFLMHLICVAW